MPSSSRNALSIELPGRWYVEKSSPGTGRGYSVYAVCTVGMASKRETNAALDRLAVAAAGWASRHGYAAKVEVMGRHTITATRQIEATPIDSTDCDSGSSSGTKWDSRYDLLLQRATGSQIRFRSIARTQSPCFFVMIWRDDSA